MGNLCTGGVNIRPGQEGPVFSEVEKFIAEQENNLNIQHVLYEVFERCVKRFGYAVDLTDDCWRATVDETHVDIEKFKEFGNI